MSLIKKEWGSPKITKYTRDSISIESGKVGSGESVMLVSPAS